MRYQCTNCGHEQIDGGILLMCNKCCNNRFQTIPTIQTPPDPSTYCEPGLEVDDE